MDEIEEFLRQAAARKRTPAPPSPEIQYLEPEIVEAEVLYDEPVPPAELSAVSSRQLETSAFDERAAHRGSRPARADDLMEAHLQQKFVHQVGKLAGDAADVATHYEDQTSVPTTLKRQVTVTARRIIETFRTPADIRNAMILNEILQRPEGRW